MNELAELIRERGEGRADVLWAALMVCRDCDDRMIEHDEVAMKCRVCSCDQSSRGWSTYADDYLIDLGTAIRESGAEVGGAR